MGRGKLKGLIFFFKVSVWKTRKGNKKIDKEHKARGSNREYTYSVTW